MLSKKIKDTEMGEARPHLANPALQLSEDEPSNGYLYLHAPRHMARKDPQMAEAIHLLNKHSKLAKSILKAAKKSKLSFLRYEFGNGNLGDCDAKVLRLSTTNSLIEDAAAVIPHELMHWLNPWSDYDAEWDGRTRLLYSLTSEAGAETCTARVAHEMYLNGYTEAFNFISGAADKTNSKYAPLYRAFEKTYNNSRTIGHAHDAALMDAGNETFHCYFKQSRLVKTYGDSALLDYCEYLEQHNDDHPPVAGYDMVSAKEMAKISKGQYLIYDAKLPLEDDVLFRGNKLLRQAFDYCDLWHVFNYKGACESDIGYLKKKSALINDNNPFMDVGISDVLTEYQEQVKSEKSTEFLDVMLKHAGAQDPETAQASFDFV